MKGKLQNLTATGVVLKGDKGDAIVEVLVDTGASYSMVRTDVAQRLGTATKLPETISLTIGDGSRITITDAVLLAMEIGAVKLMDYFLVFENLIEEAILGVNTMRQYGLKIDLEKQVVYATIRDEGDVMKDFLKKLFAAIGISASEDVAEDRAIELIKNKVTGERETGLRSAVLGLLELKEDADEAEIKGKILALKNPGNVVPQDYDALKAKLAVLEIEGAVNAALIDGKLQPSEREPWLKDLKEGKYDLATFHMMLSHRGKTVPTGIKLPGKQEDRSDVQIDDVQTRVNKQLGVSAEIFAKYNKES